MNCRGLDRIFSEIVGSLRERVRDPFAYRGDVVECAHTQAFLANIRVTRCQVELAYDAWVEAQQ